MSRENCGRRIGGDGDGRIAGGSDNRRRPCCDGAVGVAVVCLVEGNGPPPAASCPLRSWRAPCAHGKFGRARQITSTAKGRDSEASKRSSPREGDASRAPESDGGAGVSPRGPFCSESALETRGSSRRRDPRRPARAKKKAPPRSSPGKRPRRTQDPARGTPRRAGRGGAAASGTYVPRRWDLRGHASIASPYCPRFALIRRSLPSIRLLSETTQEVVFMEKLGDSIIAEMEAAEDEVCRAWESYYRRALDFFGSSSSEEAVPPPERGVGTPDLAAAAAPKGCPDVWVEEMRYRMAVAFLSAVWEKCSSELSKLFLSTKDAECNRRGTLKELLIKAVRRQERLWTGLPTTIAPTLGELIAWPMERKAVEDDVQSSIRERAQAVQLDEAERTRPEDEAAASRPGPGLADAPEDGGDFELSSPLVSDLLVKARVVEKRGGGIMSGWKVGLAIVTSDAYLHLFELPQGCKLAAGSAPEVAFQNLIPPVIVPSMEVSGMLDICRRVPICDGALFLPELYPKRFPLQGVKGGAKFPSARHWFDHLVPSESFALPNCAVTLTDGDAKNPTSFEVVETTEASGASKMFAKTVNRKVQFRVVTRENVRCFVDTLERSKRF
ncbi:hypothetical protein ACHAWF_003557, partial [Thalassiosira exigua]